MEDMRLRIFLVAICLLLAACDDGVINPASDLERKYPEPWISCEEGVSWVDGHRFAGKVIYILGPVQEIAPVDGAETDSLSIVLGDNDAAGREFLVNVDFGESEELQGRFSELDLGDELCVTGSVKMVDGTPLIRVSAPSQIGRL